MMLFDPGWVPASKGDDVAGRRETDRLCSERHGEGRHNREIKFKDSEREEGHIALGAKQTIKPHTAA
jgi:hypothetical protein